MAILFSIYALHLALIKKNIQPFDISKKSELDRMKLFINKHTNIQQKVATINFATSNNLLVEGILIHEASPENETCFRHDVGFSSWKYTGIFYDSWQELAENDWQIGTGKKINEINFDPIPNHIYQIKSENNNQKFLLIEVSIHCIDTVKYNYSYIFEKNRDLQLEKTFTE